MRPNLTSIACTPCSATPGNMDVVLKLANGSKINKVTIQEELISSGSNAAVTGRFRQQSVTARVDQLLS